MAVQSHCAYCYEVLAAELEDREALSFQEVQTYWEKHMGTSVKTGKDVNNALLGQSAGILSPDIEYPLFVTWRAKTARSTRELRGCKGTFRALPLAQGLRDLALISGLEDNRFAPINVDELNAGHLTCEVTLLHGFEERDDRLEDWIIGEHGIRVAFEDGGRRYGATFLPDVAPAQGWDRQDAVIAAVRKSGSTALNKERRRGRSQWEVVKSLGVSLTRYRGLKSRLRHSEWQQWRERVFNEQVKEGEVNGVVLDDGGK